MSDTLYVLKGLGKEYKTPSEQVTVLKKIDLEIRQGDSVAILGTSGSGKSTLLHILGTLDSPSWGKITFRGYDLTKIDAKTKANLRRKEIGFIFQFHHLLPEFNALENVAMPAIISGIKMNMAREMAAKALEQVGLKHRIDHNVTTLSGGERQRVAIARAILLKPRVLLADEPTGNLDENTGESISQLLIKLNQDLGMTLVVVTHNNSLAQKMNQKLKLHLGVLHEM
ncbi:ABC transporter ATP-binding protein [Desulfohalobiaceae bacterium Ax17]|uniref:ABC transporter ATP-binding protein n=1 Tax=Desulfovulcanus ferrireducens TaxID=2831190 RepID=UPI00207BB3B1|nr:ABC transporter ATP-binding protein [Desulfovulcanus ferrireducens]MBT8763268.1 ABC transporter ATP-binding protein [Desulfovulcanus ferrireducens]